MAPKVLLHYLSSVLSSCYRITEKRCLWAGLVENSREIWNGTNIVDTYKIGKYFLETRKWFSGLMISWLFSFNLYTLLLREFVDRNEYVTFSSCQFTRMGISSEICMVNYGKCRDHG